MAAEPIILASQRTVGQALASTAARRGGAVALEHAGRRCTFAELHAISARLANALTGLGLRRGERICVLAENRAEYAFILYAAARIGLAVCPLNWRLPAAELRPVMASVGPRLAFVSARHRTLFSAAASGDVRVVALDAREDDADLEFGALLGRRLEADPAVPVDAEDILVITHTSGTTGFPKGAMLSHRGVIARALGFAADQGWRPEESFIAWSPIFHTGGVDGLLVSGVIGGKCTIIDGMQPEQIARTVVAEPVNWLFLPPGGIGQVVDALAQAGRAGSGSSGRWLTWCHPS